MKDVTVRTNIPADELNEEGLKAAGKNADGSQADFTGGRTFPFPTDMKEVPAWEAAYAKLAKEKGWKTEADFLADAETGHRIRMGKEIREFARERFGKETKAETKEKAAAPVGTVL